MTELESTPSRAHKLQIIVGLAAVVLGVVAFIIDLAQGDGFNAGPLVAVAVGAVVIAYAWKRAGGSQG